MLPDGQPPIVAFTVLAQRLFYHDLFMNCLLVNFHKKLSGRMDEDYETISTDSEDGFRLKMGSL